MVDISQNPTKVNYMYLLYMYKENLGSNNLQWLISNKTQPNPIKYI